MNPGARRCSFMLCLRAICAGSLGRFWAWRDSKRVWLCEARRGEAAEPAALAELEELVDEVESARSVRRTVGEESGIVGVEVEMEVVEVWGLRGVYVCNLADETGGLVVVDRWW
jgi:hypothetical protein